MTALQTAESHEVARPLKVLTPLIKSDVENGDKAGMTHFIHAGEKLIEAKDGHFANAVTAFWRYAEKTTGKSRTTVTTWMGAAAVADRKTFKSLRQFRQSPKHEGGLGVLDSKPVVRDWAAPVDAVAERARREAVRLAEDDIRTRAQEREAERALAHRLIDIGFKVLAKELHPDKVGGDKTAMKRLNTVRDKLKHSI